MPRNKNRTFFSQLFLVFIFSFTLLVLVLTVVFYFGVRISLADWNFHSGRRLQGIILPAVTQIYRQNGKLEEQSVYSGLSPFLTVNMYLHVFDAQKNPVFFFVRGERISLSNQERIADEIEKIGDSRRRMRAIVNESDVVGYLSVGTFGFTYNLANRSFLQSIIVSIIAGVGIALAFALIISFLFSKILSKNTRILSEAINSITAGKKTLNFPTRGAKELIEIATAAQELSDNLEHESRLRKKMSQDIAHDLKTPVTALKTQFENMVEGVTEASRERISSLYSEITRIEHLIYDLFQLSKMENPEMTLTIQEINVSNFIRELEFAFRNTFRDKGIVFTVSHAVSCFDGDENLLYRAVSNVLQNAFQHTLPRKTVSLHIEENEGCVILTIRNSGRIDPEEIPRFFERMYRGENSRAAPGTGLGLPITQAICSLHGGRAEISQEEQDTVVRIIVPSSHDGKNTQTGSPRNR